MKRAVLVVALVLAGGALPAHSADAPPTKKQIAQCVELAKNEYIWKDKESVRAEDARWKNQSNHGIRVMHVAINAKNSYGAYTGAKYTWCMCSDGKAIAVRVDDTPYYEMLESIKKPPSHIPLQPLFSGKNKSAPIVIHTQPARPATPDKGIFFKPE